MELFGINTYNHSNCIEGLERQLSSLIHKKIGNIQFSEHSLLDGVCFSYKCFQFYMFSVFLQKFRSPGVCVWELVNHPFHKLLQKDTPLSIIVLSPSYNLLIPAPFNLLLNPLWLFQGNHGAQITSASTTQLLW